MNIIHLSLTWSLGDKWRGYSPFEETLFQFQLSPPSKFPLVSTCWIAPRRHSKFASAAHEGLKITRFLFLWVWFYFISWPGAIVWDGFCRISVCDWRYARGTLFILFFFAIVSVSLRNVGCSFFPSSFWFIWNWTGTWMKLLGYREVEECIIGTF